MTDNAPGTACCENIPGYGTISDAAAVFSGNAAQICFSGEVDFFQIQVFYHAVSADHAKHSAIIQRQILEMQSGNHVSLSVECAQKWCLGSANGSPFRIADGDIFV